MSFEIHVTGCRALRPKGRISKKLDPYVKLHLGQQPKQKTKIVKNSLNPKYDETFRYQSWGEEEVLRVSVWSHDRITSNQCLGEIYLPYPNDPTGVHEQEYNLLTPLSSRRFLTHSNPQLVLSPSSKENSSPPFSNTNTVSSPMSSTTSSPTKFPPSPKVTITTLSADEKDDKSDGKSDDNVVGYITLQIINSKQQEIYEKQKELEKKQKEKEESDRMELQMRFAREELESRKPKKEEPEQEKKRPPISIELPEVFRKTATIVHNSPPRDEERPLNSTTKEQTTKPEEPTSGHVENTTTVSHTPKEEVPCCVCCHKDISCLIL